MPTLHNIDIQIPYDSNLQSKLSDLLENCTNRSGNTLFVNPTSPEFLPIISMSFVNIEEPKIVFGLEKEDAEKLIINTTGEERTSPYKYKHLSIDEISDRIKNNGRIVYVDHLGVNFPWLDGLSPTVKDLRDKLTPASAYYRFPSGENWDFIIPATSNEIESNKIDLKINRRPKFEIVSFYKSSTPIIQIDCSTNIPYEKLKTMFPEGIFDEELRNVWVYTKNSFKIDICFIFNEPHDSDWSDFFENHRLLT